MNIPKLTDEVKGKVYFVSLVNKDQAKQLWYKTDSGFQFPVPLFDTIGAEFLAEDKAIYFTRWIGRHIKELQEEKDNEKERTI